MDGRRRGAGRGRACHGAAPEPAPASAYPPRPPPAPIGCFGLTCLVTWIVRRMTLVRTSGLVATDRRPLAAGAQRKAGETAEADDRRDRRDPGLKALHVIYLLAGICVSQSGGCALKRTPGAGKETAKPPPGRQRAFEGGVTVARWRSRRRRRADPRGRGRGLDLPALCGGAAPGWIRGDGDPHRRRRAGAGGGGGAGPGDARPQPSRRRRPRRLPRAAPPIRRADRDADRARHRDGPDRRPRAGRRRLRRQALQRPRGDLADPGRAAAQRSRATEPARRRRRSGSATSSSTRRLAPRASPGESSTFRARSSTCSPS